MNRQTRQPGGGSVTCLQATSFNPWMLLISMVLVACAPMNRLVSESLTIEETCRQANTVQRTLTLTERSQLRSAINCPRATDPQSPYATTNNIVSCALAEAYATYQLTHPDDNSAGFENAVITARKEIEAADAKLATCLFDAKAIPKYFADVKRSLSELRTKLPADSETKPFVLAEGSLLTASAMIELIELNARLAIEKARRLADNESELYRYGVFRSGYAVTKGALKVIDRRMLMIEKKLDKADVSSYGLASLGYMSGVSFGSGLAKPYTQFACRKPTQNTTACLATAGVVAAACDFVRHADDQPDTAFATDTLARHLITSASSPEVRSLSNVGTAGTAPEKNVGGYVLANEWIARENALLANILPASAQKHDATPVSPAVAERQEGLAALAAAKAPQRESAQSQPARAEKHDGEVVAATTPAPASEATKRRVDRTLAFRQLPDERAIEAIAASAAEDQLYRDWLYSAPSPAASMTDVRVAVTQTVSNSVALQNTITIQNTVAAPPAQPAINVAPQVQVVLSPAKPLNCHYKPPIRIKVRGPRAPCAQSGPPPISPRGPSVCPPPPAKVCPDGKP